MTTGTIAVSDAVLNEYRDVLFRPKFDKYLNQDERLRLLNTLLKNAQRFSTKEPVSDCRDPKDNKFLELALAANAAGLITGDPHLLDLHPFRNIPIITVANFLKDF